MLANLFRKNPPPPLKQALLLARQANEIVMQHKRDKSYMPSVKDLNLLEQIETEFSNAKSVASYVHRCLQQRQEGKPEGAAKFTNQEAFDYHYPDS